VIAENLCKYFIKRTLYIQALQEEEDAIIDYSCCQEKS
jgi:hypothetical protein